MTDRVEEVIPGVDVGTFDALKDLTHSSFPYAGGLVVLEVYSRAVGKIPVTPHDEVLDALRQLKDMPEPTKPRWVSIVFGGWDEDKRHVVVIPECQSWCRRFVTMAGPELLSVITYEPEAINSGHLLASEAGFGIMKLLVTAGYGISEIRPDCDARSSASDNTALDLDEDGMAPVLYRLNEQGEHLAEAAVRHKHTSRFIER